MQYTVSLNDAYEEYASGLIGFDELEAAIFVTLKGNARLSFGWNPDDFSDYIAWLYPRIKSAIYNYRETGSSFEAYIYSMVRLTAREFRGIFMRHYTSESAAWITQIPDMFTCEPEVEYLENIAKGRGLPEREAPKLSNPRQLLILVLKCCSYISGDFTEKISAQLEINADDLLDMFENLREMREKRESRINGLREKANSLFCQCLFYDQTLRAMPEKSVFTQRLKEHREQSQKKLDIVRRKLSRLHTDPSNNQIAQVLGLSKGAVDSALHALKKRGFRLDPGDQSKHILN